MHPNDFGWELINNGNEIKKDDGCIIKLGDFLTKELDVTYSDTNDNKRKSDTDKYKKWKETS